MTLYDRYKFFKAHAGYIVGACARNAMDLAKAEIAAEEHGLFAEWQHDPAPYMMGDAETEHPSEVLCCLIRVSCDADDTDACACRDMPRCLASLGGIGDPSRTYARVVEAELFSEALHIVAPTPNHWLAL